MGFKREEVSALMAQCHRRCCICHRFCGVKMETDHIVPQEQSVDDTIENAIPVCFECHAEIHGYNDKHPRGRKFTPEELRLHKQQWLTICSEKTHMLLEASRSTDVGPLQALIDELEFNRYVASKLQINELGCLYHTQQLLRAINDGAISILKDDLRDAIINAYHGMDTTNQLLSGLWHHNRRSSNWAEMANDIQARHRALLPVLDSTMNKMLEFLGKDE